MFLKNILILFQIIELIFYRLSKITVLYDMKSLFYVFYKYKFVNQRKIHMMVSF